MFKFSAEDIANQTFQTRFRGYDAEQVHEFLDGLAGEWRQIQKSFRSMKEEFDQQTRELRDYRRREKSLVQALEMARQVAEEIRHQADRDAEMMLADTELKAERMLARAEKKVSELRGEIFELQQHRVRYHSEMRQMLESYGTMLDQYEARGTETGSHPLPPIPGSRSESEREEEVVNNSDIVVEESREAAT